MKYYTFLFLDNRMVDSLLNVAIVVLNPRAKWPAHVTVAGPYPSKRNVPKNLLYKRAMLVMGAGQFRSGTQNTVFLKVSAPDLKKISKKTDYGFNPHLTLYDGIDHDLGDEFYRRLSRVISHASFVVSNLEIVQAGQPQRDLNLLLDKIDGETLRSLGVEIGEIEKYSLDRRVTIAIEAIRKAVRASWHPIA